MKRTTLTLRCLAAAVLAGVSGCATAPYAQRPPPEYRGNRTVAVSFVDRPSESCREMGSRLGPGQYARACEQAQRLVLPNPCTWPDQSDFVQLVCHELGHANGWPGDHPTR